MESELRAGQIRSTTLHEVSKMDGFSSLYQLISPSVGFMAYGVGIQLIKGGLWSFLYG